MQELLTRAGINKAELARQLGMNPRSVSAWGNNPPQYAVAYLELLIKYRKITI